jgi:hypothetical protein
VTIAATGGNGGIGMASTSTNSHSTGMEITGILAVQPQQELLVPVGGEGADMESKDDAPGCWSGLGAVGGDPDNLGSGGSACCQPRTGDSPIPL